jgi:hypothetical protein
MNTALMMLDSRVAQITIGFIQRTSNNLSFPGLCSLRSSSTDRLRFVQPSHHLKRGISCILERLRFAKLVKTVQSCSVCEANAKPPGRD